MQVAYPSCVTNGNLHAVDFKHPMANIKNSP